MFIVPLFVQLTGALIVVYIPPLSSGMPKVKFPLFTRFKLV